MSTVDIHPSTLGGIKRLAKSIKREQNLSHIQALDEAARAAGFQNLRHAQNALPASTARHPRSSSYPLYLTAYWRTREGGSGRESLLVQMRQSWCELLRPRQLARTRALRYFRIDANDHLETIDDIDGQERAREIICAAVRTLEFMEATGLRPATGRTREFQRHTHGLPGHDHSSIWIDPKTKHFVLSDEPYKDGPDFVSGRMAWARDSGLVMTTPTWPGMYVPGSSVLTLVAPLDFEVRLRAMTDQLNQLREPIVSEHWDGESATYTPIFLSPLRQASGRIKRGRPHPVRSGEYRNGAVAYGNILLGTQWRPAARMPLSAHKEAAQMLNALLSSSHFSARTHGQIDSVRSELDEWVQREYTSVELPADEFHALYYGNYETEDLLPEPLINRVMSLVKEHYPNCAPRRSILRTMTSIRKAALGH